MGAILKRARDFALYGDTDRESYAAIQDKIMAANRLSTLVFGSVGAILISIMVYLSYTQESFSASRPVYYGGVVLSLVMVAVGLASRKYPFLTYVGAYMAVSCFLVYGIAIAMLTRPEEMTVTFMVLLIFVPLIFVDCPLRMGIVQTAFVVAFILMAYRYKAADIISADVSDAAIFGLLAVVSQSVINRTKIRGYVLEQRLHIMSETDQLTGLNNRNCYEYRLGQYPSLYTRSICCVYVDGDGLHELNNQQGHQEGDKMLRTVANAMRDAFGSSDTYRIGGDEFVAIVLDRTREETERGVREMRSTVESAGYHASIGFEYAEKSGTEFEELVRQAEADMYRAKAEYYQLHDRRRR